MLTPTAGTKYFVENKTLFVSDDFNEKFDLNYESLKDINTLIFGQDCSEKIYSIFDQLIDLMPNITILTLGKEF